MVLLHDKIKLVMVIKFKTSTHGYMLLIPQNWVYAGILQPAAPHRSLHRSLISVNLPKNLSLSHMHPLTKLLTQYLPDPPDENTYNLSTRNTPKPIKCTPKEVFSADISLFGSVTNYSTCDLNSVNVSISMESH